MATYNPNTSLYGTSTNPVTGVNTPGLLFNAPNAQNPFGSYSSNVNTTLNPNLINAGALGSNTQLTIPGQTPQPTPQQMVAGFTPIMPPTFGGINPLAGGATQQATNQLGQQEQYQNQLLGQYSGLRNQLGQQGQVQLQLEQQAGIPQLNQELANLNTQFAQRQNAYLQQQNQAANGGLIGNEAIGGSLGRIARQQAMELGGLSLIINAKQGNLEGVKADVDRILDLEFEPIKQQIEDTKFFLEVNKDNMSRTEAKQAQALQVSLAREARAADAARENRRNATDIAMQLNKAGSISDADLLAVVTGKKSLSDITSMTKQDVAVVADATAKIGQLNAVLKNKSGLGATVGPRGLGRIELFRKGKAQTFAADIHQITSQLTLDKLIASKGQGATFGALSDGERMALANAATILNAAEIKDKNGNPTGQWALPEASVTKELGKIKDFLKLDYKRRTGMDYIEPLEEQTSEDLLSAVPATNVTVSNQDFFR